MSKRNTIGDILLRLVICEPTTLHTGCWEWRGHVNTSGHGQVKLQGKLKLVHRLVYEHFIGPIPSDREIHHRCENQRCANFEHLQPVTDLEHTHLGNNVGARNARKTHCDYGHSYSGSNLIVRHRNGRPVRICRVCRAARKRRYRARLKAATSPAADSEP